MHKRLCHEPETFNQEQKEEQYLENSMEKVKRTVQSTSVTRDDAQEHLRSEYMDVYTQWDLDIQRPNHLSPTNSSQDETGQ